MKVHQASMRLPTELYVELATRAHAEGTSVNHQLVLVVRAGMAQQADLLSLLRELIRVHTPTKTAEPAQ